MNTRSSALRLATKLAIVAVMSGCASSRFAPRFVSGRPSVEDLVKKRVGVEPKESKASFARRIRRLVDEARATARSPNSMAITVEATDSDLRDALTHLALAPSPSAHRQVASHYTRLGIKDMAYEHLTHAIRLNKRDAAAYDARARLWRDLGLPHLGIGDAHRAVYYAKSSPVAHNTLGTLLEALGLHEEARLTYEKAVTLDPQAWYARANVDRLTPRVAEVAP
jgi:tetratricopeptide (TPR) repeat protein